MLKQLNVKPLHQGVLLKQSDWLKTWRPRFFAIYGSRLFVCPDENPTDTDEAKVEIDFSQPSPHMTLEIKSIPDKKSGSNYYQLCITKIKGKSQGWTVRSLCTNEKMAKDDLTQWLRVIEGQIRRS